MRARAMRERIMGIAACGCAGGFVASALGHHLGAFPGMDLVGAGMALALGAWAEVTSPRA